MEYIFSFVYLNLITSARVIDNTMSNTYFIMKAILCSKITKLNKSTQALQILSMSQIGKYERS